MTAYSPIPLIRDAFASTAGRQRQAGSSLARSAQARPSFDDDGLAGGYDERCDLLQPAVAAVCLMFVLVARLSSRNRLSARPLCVVCHDGGVTLLLCIDL